MLAHHQRSCSYWRLGGCVVKPSGDRRLPHHEEELEDEREGVAGGDVDGERGGAPVDAGDDGAGAHGDPWPIVVPIPVIGPAPRVHWSTLP